MSLKRMDDKGSTVSPALGPPDFARPAGYAILELPYVPFPLSHPATKSLPS